MIEHSADRAPALDLGRFLAALAVYGYHSLYLDPHTGRVPWDSAVDWIACYGNLGVQYFFMLSGYVICWSAEGRTPIEFTRNRVARLYPAFIVCVVLASVSLAATGEAVGAARFAANLTFQANVLGFAYIDRVYWSLAAETLFYAAIVLVAVGPRLRRRLRIAIVVWGLIALLPIKGPPMVLLNLQWASYFCVGIALFLWRAEGKRSDFLLFLSFVAMSAYKIHERTFSVGTKLDVQPDPLVASAIVVLLGLSLPWLSRLRMGPTSGAIAVLAGALSYPLYLLHNEFHRPILIAAWNWGWPSIVVANLSLFLVCYLVYRVEVPLRRRMRKFGRRQTSDTVALSQQPAGSGIEP